MIIRNSSTSALRLTPWTGARKGQVKMWKQHWLILRANCLYYFEYMMDKESRESSPWRIWASERWVAIEMWLLWALYPLNIRRSSSKSAKQTDSWMAEGNMVCDLGPMRKWTRGSKSFRQLWTWAPSRVVGGKEEVDFLLTKTIKSPSLCTHSLFSTELPTPVADWALQLWILVSI